MLAVAHGARYALIHDVSANCDGAITNSAWNRLCARLFQYGETPNSQRCARSKIANATTPMSGLSQPISRHTR